LRLRLKIIISLFRYVPVIKITFDCYLCFEKHDNCTKLRKILILLSRKYTGTGKMVGAGAGAENMTCRSRTEIDRLRNTD
jgi:hypothetical protein